MNSSSQGFNRFADYFVICGLDLNSGLEPDHFAGDSLHCTPLDRSYKAQVLAHYPDVVSWNPFDENAVCMLCLPHGLQFRTQKHCIEPHFHSFIITREDGSHSYGFSYIFFEEVKNRKICSAMQTLQAMHLTELSSCQQSGRGKSGRKSKLSADGSHNTRSLPRHFKLSMHQPAAAQSYYDTSKDILFVAKSISLIAQLPYVHAAQKFLEGLYRCAISPKNSLSLESHVYNLLFEVPAPQPGRSLRFLCPGGEAVVVQRPSTIEELPFFDLPIRLLFKLLGVENTIQLFTCVLLENQILLYSSDYQRLIIVAESITCLLFPFTWQHVYVPILPASLQHFLDAPVPFVMGLHSGEAHQRLASESSGNLCFVDIDHQKIQLPEELPTFPQRQEFVAELVEILRKYGVPTGPLGFISNISGSSSNLMTTSCTLPHSRRKHSWSHDSDSGVSDGSQSSAGSPQSDELQRMVAIVRSKGIGLDDLIDGNLNNEFQESERELTDDERYIEDLRFNNAVREIFLNRFVNIFSAYEHFIIQPNQNKEQWLSNRDSMQNFDKATFLSDQPEHHLPFLSRFIESQMFATLIDNKIMSLWSETDSSLRVFDKRIKLLRKRFGESLVRTPGYEPCTTIRESELLLEKRFTNVNVVISYPQEVLPSPRKMSAHNASFPILDSSVLKEPLNRSRKQVNNTQWRTRRERQLSGDSDGVCESLRQPKLSTSDMSPALIAQTNWTFVDKLLKDVKSKTKRMLVAKMGTEAFELGHPEISLCGVEENTLIASLCDLLERIWSHGLQHKQGKSGLWTHLTNYQELEECNDTSKPIDPNFLTPATPSPKFGLPDLLLTIKSGNIFEIVSNLSVNFDLSSMALETDMTPPQSRSRDRHKSPEHQSPGERKVADGPVLKPLPVSLTFDMRNVQAMADIKTQIGYARAWVRLSLEKKLLYRHLRTLLADSALLRSQYKRYAFLRCEDEKEQFLYHLLTLNAVDYFCFTNTYPNTKLPYRVVIFPSRKTSASSTTAHSWVTISGTLGETSQVPIPRGNLEFVFQHKNLGLLTTLRIGHDNTGPSPRWMVEHVVVRNEVTGHTYKFPCGRWLGRGIDDGSTERLLVGELVPQNVRSEQLAEVCRTPPRCRSPSVPRRPSETRPLIPEIRQMLSDAVNNIVKFFYQHQSEKERAGLTFLLCGEMGLVYCLEQVFSVGFKSVRLFGRNLYLWDYFVRVKEQLEEVGNLKNDTVSSYISLVDQVDHSSQSLGKDGKFQLFVCLCARDHLLHRMIPLLTETRATIDMYEEQSFLRNQTDSIFLKQILESLDEFNIVLENSLTKGIGP